MAETEELRIVVAFDGEAQKQVDQITRALSQFSGENAEHHEKLRKGVDSVGVTVKELAKVLGGQGPEALIALVGKVGAIGAAVAATATATYEAIKKLHEASKEFVTMSQAAAAAGQNLAQFRMTIEALVRSGQSPEQAMRNAIEESAKFAELQKVGPNQLIEELTKGMPPGSPEAAAMLKYIERYRNEPNQQTRMMMAVRQANLYGQRQDDAEQPELGAAARRRFLRAHGLTEEMRFVKEIGTATEEQIAAEKRRQEIAEKFFEQSTLAGQAWDRLQRSLDVETMKEMLGVVRLLATGMNWLATALEALGVKLSYLDLILFPIMPGLLAGTARRSIRDWWKGKKTGPGAQHFSGSGGFSGDELDRALIANTEQLSRLNEFIMAQEAAQLAAAAAVGSGARSGGGKGAGSGAPYGSDVGADPSGQAGRGGGTSSAGPDPAGSPAPAPSSGPGSSAPASAGGSVSGGSAGGPAASSAGAAGFSPGWMAPESLGAAPGSFGGAWPAGGSPGQSMPGGARSGASSGGGGSAGGSGGDASGLPQWFANPTGQGSPIMMPGGMDAYMSSMFVSPGDRTMFDRMDGGGGSGAQSIRGKLDVTVEAPEGVEVKTSGDGIFHGNHTTDRRFAPQE